MGHPVRQRAEMNEFEQIIAARADLEVFAGLIAHAIPGQIEAASSGGQIHTLFAPSDSAFAALATSLGFAGGTETQVRDFLIATLSPAELADTLNMGFVETTHTVQTTEKTIQTQAGYDIGVGASALSDHDPESPDAHVLHGNLEAGTGLSGPRFVHVLDQVLLPYDIAGNAGGYPVDPGAPTAGDDTLIGDDTAQSIDLLDGDNTYDARGGDDLIYAGGGNDDLFGGDGDDQITSRAGDDRVRGGNGDDFLRAGSGNDEVRGNNGDDRVKGDGGTDLVSGGAGNDIVDGGNGNDKVKGDRGDDTLYGGDGDDILVEGWGAGILNGGRGDDWMKGDQDADTFVFEADSGNDFIVDFEDGLDLLDMRALALGGIGDLTITQDGADTLIAMDAANSVRLGKFNATDIGADDFLFV